MFSRLLSAAFALFAGLGLSLASFAPQALAQREVPPIQMKKVADDLYFWFDYAGTNSIVWATNDGIMVIDSQPHPVLARRLISEIRKISDKPIRWVVNTQVHGDHYMGNSEFKKEGATIIANAHVAFLMERYFEKDLSRRAQAFEKAGMPAADVKLVLPDRTFEDEMTIEMAGRKVLLFYPGPAQDPGCSYVHFPHARAVATSGSMTPMSLSNLMYTPSVDGWIKVLRRLESMDVDTYLPGHGDLGRKKDVEQTIEFLSTLQSGVREAIAKGTPVAEAQKTLTFPAFKDWRNAGRMPEYVRNLYVLEQTGKPEFWDKGWERK